MPIFEYLCNNCKKRFEKIVFPSGEGNICCPKCFSEDISKQISPFAAKTSSDNVCSEGKSSSSCPSYSPH